MTSLIIEKITHLTIKQTNKVIGKMKDECAGIPIAEYIGLRPKFYSVFRADEQIIKNTKGVKKYVINKHINSFVLLEHLAMLLTSTLA